MLQNAVHVRREAAAAVLAQEEPRRIADFSAVQNAFKLALHNLEADLTDRIARTFRVHRDSLQPISAHLDRVAAAESQYYDVHIPDLNERQCGESIRGIQQTKESVELDNQTVRHAALLCGPC